MPACWRPPNQRWHPTALRARKSAASRACGSGRGESGPCCPPPGVESGGIVYGAHEAVCELFHASDPLRVVFDKNVTEVLNLALRGLLRSGDNVVTSSMEHNSMMRPLHALERGVCPSN